MIQINKLYYALGVQDLNFYGGVSKFLANLLVGPHDTCYSAIVYIFNPFQLRFLYYS